MKSKGIQLESEHTLALSTTRKAADIIVEICDVSTVSSIFIKSFKLSQVVLKML